jgi:uncharacterized protein YlxP (DUF503 family)
MGFVAVVLIELHFPEGSSLKGKRKELLSLKAHLQRRFGASVAETGHHELWQRATLTATLVGREAGPLRDHADGLERYVLAQFPEGVRFERGLVSVEEVLD